MKIGLLTVGDIMVTNMLFYDSAREDACRKVCEKLFIDYLPAVDGQRNHELTESGFQPREITERYRLDIHHQILHPDMPDCFADNRNNVLFVYEGNVLRGVTHISDYNQNIVIQALQDDLLVFERNLRLWLRLNEFTNDSMVEFFCYKRDKSKDGSYNQRFWDEKYIRFSQKVRAMKELRPFQLFDFSDLLYLANSSFTEKIFSFPQLNEHDSKKDGVSVLRELRNMAMHGKDPVSRSNETGLFSLDSLRTFVREVNYLRIEHY